MGRRPVIAEREHIRAYQLVARCSEEFQSRRVRGDRRTGNEVAQNRGDRSCFEPGLERFEIIHGRALRSDRTTSTGGG